MKRRAVIVVAVTVLLLIVSGVMVFVADWPVNLCWALLAFWLYGVSQRGWYALTDPLMVFPVEPLALHAQPNRVVHGVLHVGAVVLPVVLVVYDDYFTVVTLPHMVHVKDVDVVTGEQACSVRVDDVHRVIVRVHSLDFELAHGLLGRTWVSVPIAPLTRELCEGCQDVRVPKDRSVARRVYCWWLHVLPSRDRLSLT